MAALDHGTLLPRLDARRGAATERWLPPGWPLRLYLAAFPLSWALGLAGFAAPLVALPMLAWLLRASSLRIPRGAGPWCAFLLWVGISYLALDPDAGSRLGFLYRAVLYLSASVMWLYAYNQPEAVRRRTFHAAALLWIASAVLGVAALVRPTFQFPSPVEQLLPEHIASNPFVNAMVHPRLAQEQDFLGYPVPRPAAPFPYTNYWGAGFAVLAPFFVGAWLSGPKSRRTMVGIGLAVVGAVPAVVSVNRGLWLSLGAGLAYAGGRAWAADHRRVVATASSVIVVIAIAAAFTPLGGLVRDRLATPHSNEGRMALYEEVLQRVDESPVLGFGGPERTRQVGRVLPPVGTHGHFWHVLFSHGIVGAALFVGWFVTVIVATFRCRGVVGRWSHVAMVVALVQLPFYDLLPIQLDLVMVAAGLALAERDSRPPVVRP